MIQKSVLFFILAFVIVGPFFQNCAAPVTFNEQQVASSSLGAQSGNGDGYGGKPTSYEYRDNANLCTDLGANQIPLPNAQIFIYPLGKIQLVRENCATIPPLDLRREEITLSATGDLTFQNRIYAVNSNPGDFDIFRAPCPAGRSLLASPVRTNAFQNSQNLLASTWDFHPGIATDNAGSLGSLPLYRIYRNDAAQVDKWRRLAKSVNLTAGVDYVYSFYVKSHPTEKVYFNTYPFSGGFWLEVEFDLNTGAANVVRSDGATNVSFAVRSVDGGLFISVFYRPVSTDGYNQGISPLSENLGSNILATALQFETVSNYCAP